MYSSRGNRGRIHLPIWAGAFVALICVAILVLSGWREWSTRDAELQNAEIDMANLAQSLAQHANDTFELTDNVLIGMVHRLQIDGAGIEAIARLQTFIDLRKRGMGRIRGLFVYDETGRWLATSETVSLKDFNNSDRDYFRHHAHLDDRAMLIGRPVKSRSGGQWIITASKRFNHPDGRFAGVVLASLDAAYFAQFFEKFNIGRNGAVSLLNSDGIVLARHPDNDVYIGRDLSSTPLFKERDKHPASAPYYFKSPLDGVQRLSFYKTSENFPLMILATQAQEEVLAPWRQDAATRTMIVVALLTIIAVIGFYFVRQLQARHLMGAALEAKEADFRLLAEESSDMVTRIGMDERIRYVSPSSIRVVGWRPEQLLGTPALAGVNAEDMPRVKAMIATLKWGDEEDARIAYRSRHREKAEIWIESTMRVTKEYGTAEINGVVAISRDMTEHKDLEQKLAALATIDGLTGLANRRHFDEHLEREWARARRDGTTLSLLLIDVDHFKKYNDRYGHQAGDACLKSVAQALAAQARRPADMAARYGGEEFVLLLPDTDSAGCEQMGKKIRDCLAVLGIDHEFNLPSRKLTVSIGGATIDWQDPQAQSSSLIEAADQALYSAKDEGRDRMVMSGPVLAPRLIAPGLTPSLVS
ncbi:MAG: diguanylate cyclase [Bradyrhizobium sp.]|uniref:diguanylate cyclase domain-containing protein n=1 Tax=Bradyrhizobium sp. TaxID=376 RepID=UPI0027248576|nr:diguanylate cyclase [Bradyrhizobium sp.]MDO8399527.1 diguanylate cyclase [Bradyrhizobium sp.]